MSRSARRTDRDPGDGSTVGGLQVLQGIEALAGLGVPQQVLLDVVGVGLTELEQGTRIPLRAARRLFAVTEERTGDRLCGLHAGERVVFRGPLAYLLMSCPQLRRGLQLFARFAALAIDTLRQTLEEDGAVASLVTDLDGGSSSGDRHLLDYTMMGSMRTLRMAAGPDFRLLEAHLRCAAPAGAADVERAYGCPVRFRQRDDRILFPRRMLDARSGMSNPLVALELEKLLQALTATSPRDAFRTRAEAATRALVAAGQRPSAPVIARRMHVSARTLQRRLEEEQTTFNAIRDVVLRDITVAQLRSPQLSIKEIASSVGFADVSTFSKAFKRWTGRSPGDFRTRSFE